MGQVVSMYEYEDQRASRPTVTHAEPANVITLPVIRIERLREKVKLVCPSFSPPD